MALAKCDLASNWKLDGEVKDHLDAGGPTQVKVRGCADAGYDCTA